MKQGMQQHGVMRQDLRINPRLYQAMDLLYMPLLDLQQHLKQELLANPFLELEEPEEETEVELKDETGSKEEERDADEPDWESILLDDGPEGAGLSRDFSEAREYVEPVPVESKDLSDHLREQVQMLDLTPRQQLLAEEFLGNIAEDGYLGATLEEIVAGVNKVLEGYAERAAPDTEEDLDEFGGEGHEAPPQPAADTAPASTAHGEPTATAAPAAPAIPWYTVAEAEEMLRLIQKLDPPGVGARDLRECLLLQLQDKKEADTLAYRLVHDAFEDLKAHRWSDLGKRFGLEPAEVQRVADDLARLDPKPGLQYSAGGDQYITPDLIVEKIDGKYQVFLNDTGLPRLRISKTYQDIVRDRKKFQGENKEFINQRMNSAHWMLQAIEQRRQTMLKVMNFIVDRQREFFDKGVEYLKPLTLREVADVINMHESTVSRVTNEKYVQTPRGLLPLKFFFSSGLQTTTGEDASARAIKAQIKKLVDDEDPKNPLTDQEIVQQFEQRGVKIARRTVAKYRDQLNVLPARMRKRL
jgi:RNA polymerase sigma-54 factor